MSASRPISALVVAGLLTTGAALFPGLAIAGSNSRTVRGHVEDTVVTDGSCQSPVGICTAGRLTGGLGGELGFTITSLAPTTTPGVAFFTALSTIHTGKGDVFCADSGSFNTTPSSGGEGVHLCEITGGTGSFSGATGYLQEVFNFVGTTAKGDYQGTIVLP